MIKKIWVYWDQGFENAPKIVKECNKSIKYYNPGWEVINLSDKALNDLNIDIPDIKQTAAKSDYIRIAILQKYGGLWVDSTVMFNKSLDDWLSDYTDTGFFGFSRPSINNEICSWFLYADTENYIVDTWFKSVCNYWNNRTTPHTYLWFHGLFDTLYNTDNTFKTIWNNTNKYQATHTPRSYDGANPHIFAPYDLNHLKQVDQMVTKFNAPVYKLNRSNPALLPSNTIKSFYVKDKQ